MAKYKQLNMPEEFKVEVPYGDLWMETGTYRWDEFIEDDNQPGVYVNAMIGMPFFLRVTKIDGDLYTVEDGEGDEFVYRITPIISNPAA
jgi:hypothetical protein